MRIRWAVLLIVAMPGGLVVPAGGDLPVGLRFDGATVEDRFGFSVAGAGDVNGDGVPDLIVGAPYADPGGRAEAGSAYVFSGADGAQLFRFDGETAISHLGYCVAGAGDVNSDGVADIIVGAPDASPGGRGSAGTAFIFSGANGSQLFRFDGAVAEDQLGWSVAGTGDVNGDGRADVIVGVPYAYAGPTPTFRAGCAFIFSGANGQPLFRLRSGSPDLFGYSVAGVGDVTGDGVPDVVVGAPGASPGGRSQAGSAYTFSGKDGALVRRLDGTVYGGYLGNCVAGAGDVNADGVRDVVVSAPEIIHSPSNTQGSAFVFSGADGSQLFRFDGPFTDGNGYGGVHLRLPVASAGDVNGDGHSDVAVGAPLISPSGRRAAGSTFVFSGANAALIRRLDGPASGDYLGSSVAPAGDVNGDGLAHVMVGAPGANPGGRDDAGSVWVVTPVGPSVVINPPPVPGGASATNNPVVNLLLPVVGAHTVELRQPDQSSWSGPFLYTPTRAWTFTPGEGLRPLLARYRDFSGNFMAEVSDDIILDQSAPVVSIQSPAAGSVVKAVVGVAAQAADTLSGVGGVMFKLDGNLRSTDTSPPYAWNWDTRLVQDGPHTLSARAFDNVGNFKEASATVTVDNPTFRDVPESHIFWRFIEAVASAGITSGCSGSPPLYCPEDAATRGQMAKLLCKAAGKTWLDATTPTFADVPRGHTFYGWIERLAHAGSWGGNPPTSGCRTVGATRYFCPNDSVTRAQMAKFLCVARGKTWLARSTPTFSDVPTNHLFYGWIERLGDAGSWGGTAPTSGCGGGKYCPNDTVKRDQMAKFLVLAFGLPY